MINSVLESDRRTLTAFRLPRRISMVESNISIFGIYNFHTTGIGNASIKPSVMVS